MQAAHGILPAEVTGPDSDGDGIHDEADNCPVDFNPIQTTGFLGEVTLSVAVFDGPHFEWSETSIQIEPQAQVAPVPSLGPLALVVGVIAITLTGLNPQRRTRSAP